MGATLPLTIGFTAGTPRRAPGKPPARGDTPARVNTPAATAPASSAASHPHVDAAHDIAAWVRHAEAANGFGGDAAPGFGGDAAIGSPYSYRLHLRARASRAAYIGELIGAGLAHIVLAARQANAWYRRREDARTMQKGLHELDDRTLRDIGFTRSEIESVIAEATGGAEWTRLRMRWLHGQP